MRRLLPLVFLILALPLTAQVPVSGRVVVGPAVLERDVPRVVSNGSGYLVLWIEQSLHALRGVRVGADGRRVGTDTGLHLGGRTSEYAFASDGSGWLVVRSSYEEHSVVRVEASSDVRTTVRIGDPITNPTLAWNGSTFLLVYVSGELLYSHELSRDGAFIGERRLIASGYIVNPRVAWNGSSYLIAFQRLNELFALPFDGAKAGPELSLGRITAATQEIASDGNGWLIVWSTEDQSEIRARQVDAGGNLGAERLIERALFVSAPAVTHHAGGEYLVTWTYYPEGIYREQPSSIEAARVTAGSVVAVRGSSPTATATLSSVASNGSQPVIVWTRRSSARPTTYHTDIEVLPLGERAPQTLSLAAAAQRWPALGDRDGDAELAVWSEAVPGESRRFALFAGHVTPAGPVGEPVRLFESERDQLGAQLVDRLLLWYEGNDVYAKALDEPLPPVHIGWNLGGLVAAARTGSGYTVVWQSGLSGPNLTVTRLLSNGAILDATPIDQSKDATLPALATDGERVALAWMHSTYCGIRCFPVRSIDFMMLDGTPTRIAERVMTPPVLLWNGREYVVFFTDMENRLHAIRIARDGTRIDDTVLMKVTTAPRIQAVWDGLSHVLVLNDIRDEMRILHLDRALRLTGDQTIAGEGLVPTSIAVRGPGSVAIAYEQTFHEAPLGTTKRAFVHYITPKRRSISR